MPSSSSHAASGPGAPWRPDARKWRACPTEPRRAGATQGAPLELPIPPAGGSVEPRFYRRHTVTHPRLLTALASGLTLALTAVAAPRLALAQTAPGSATERLNPVPPEERAAGWRLFFDGHSA